MTTEEILVRKNSMFQKRRRSIKIYVKRPLLKAIQYAPDILAKFLIMIIIY